MQLSLVCKQLVEHLPRMQNVMGLSLAKAAHFFENDSRMSYIVLHWESLGLYLVFLIFGTTIPTCFNI